MGSARNGKRNTRCGIYTRKSSDEGLDQTFNSLDAQREACEAFIMSQRHEGWQLISGERSRMPDRSTIRKAGVFLPARSRAWSKRKWSVFWAMLQRCTLC